MLKLTFPLLIATILLQPCMVKANANLGNFDSKEIQSFFNTPFNWHIEEQKVESGRGDTLKWVKIAPELDTNPGYSSEFENIYFNPGKNWQEKTFFDFINKIQNRYHVKILSFLYINESDLKDYLEDLKTKTKKEPVDAKFAFEGSHVTAFSLSSDGYQIDTEKSRAEIISQLETNPWLRTLRLSTETIKPTISSSEISIYGIKELIGQGVSNFRGSPKNRIHNIKLGASKFNGVLIKPDEEFSFLSVLGPVDKSTGYLPELVIKEDKTTPEYGGGMCQVSTTAFRAALNSGLKITARANHAYPVSYYNPQGLDATVYIPSPDLKFINDTGNYILIQTRIEGTQLFFNFYGTNDGRTVKIVGPQIISKEKDGSMKTVVYQEVYGPDGNLIRRDTFKSNYESPSKYPHPGEQPPPPPKKEKKKG